MIGKKLKELIRQRNTKQIKLAKYVGISPSRLSNYLSDKREPDLEMLAKMARYLSVDLNYFTDIKFSPKKEGDPSVVTVPTNGSAVVDADEACGDDMVYITYLSINSKKRAAKTKALAVSKMFLGDIENPQENAVIFEATTSLGNNHFSQGDFVIASKFYPDNTANGANVFEIGRNGKIYRYFNDGDSAYLLNESTKEISRLTDEKDYSGYFAIEWIIKKP